MIVPVIEEVLVVQKQLRLIEELHIRKSRTERHEPQTVTLRKEEVTVEQLGVENPPATEPAIQEDGV
jgi:stress response protein YsnF